MWQTKLFIDVHTLYCNIFYGKTVEVVILIK